MNSTVLLLTDGRLPAGGHAHSGGLEAAVAAGRVRSCEELARFLRGRLFTSGKVAAPFAAAAFTASGAQLSTLDAELDARTAAPALRLASRRQGKALARAGRAIWPSTLYTGLPAHPDGPHHPLTLGVVAAAAGLSAQDAALAAAYGTITAPASAAVRLLGLDPYQVHALLAQLAPDCDAIAATAAILAKDDPANLPSDSAPLADISAQQHATWEVRLFAS